MQNQPGEKNKNELVPKEEEGALWRRHHSTSSTWLRETIVQKTWFDSFILFIILLNCIFMMFDDPKNPDQNEFLKVSEIVFSIIFIIEMVLKWAAYGLWGEYKKPDNKEEIDYIGYFYDPWNVLDFVIVVTSLITLLGNAANLSALRTFRVLRPLRSITRIPPLKVLVEALLQALSDLADVVIILSFLFLFFSLFGMEVFEGVMHRRCFNENVFPTAKLSQWEQNQHLTDDSFCRDPVPTDCAPLENCKSATCPEDYPYCLEIAANPDQGLISWDNIGTAIFQIFWIISLEAWVNVMYYHQEAASPYCWPYFYSVAVVVSFFALNLCLAVVEEAYSHERDEHEEEEAQENRIQLAFDRCDTDDSGFIDREEFIAACTELGLIEDEEMNFNDMFDKIDADGNGELDYDEFRVAASGLLAFDDNLFHRVFSQISRFFEQMAREDQNNEENNSGAVELQPIARSPLDRIKATQSGKKESGQNYEKFIQNLQEKENFGLKKEKPKGKTDRLEMANDLDNEKQIIKEQHEADFKISYQAWMEARTFDDKQDEFIKDKSQFRKKIHQIVNTEYFATFVLVMIILNTISLCIQYPGISPDVENSIAGLNTFFTWFFFVEMVIKIYGLGFAGYWSSNWNKFDFAVVWLSIVDWVGEALEFSNGGGSLSALRSFRVLRILRIVGKVPSLRTLISTVGDAAEDTMWLSCILLIFLFMFAILGQNLFGEKWDEIEDVDGSYTFAENFWFSFLLVFQVITGDAWNGVMVDAAKISPNFYSIYFILCLAFGSFLILNLFVAILLSRTGDQTEQKWLEEDAADLALKYAKQNMEDLEAMKRIVRHLRTFRFQKQYRKKMQQWKMGRDRSVMMGKSFGLFSKYHPLRLACNWLIHQWWFGVFIDLSIIVSCIFMALENVNVRGEKRFRITEILFTCLFLVEMIVKMIALGVMKAPWFTDIDWHPVKLTSEEVEESENACQAAVFEMKSVDPSRILYPVHDNIVYKILESDDGFRVIQFEKTEDMRIIFDRGEFRGAFVLENTDNGKEWVEWQYDLPKEERHKAEIRRPDVLTVCKSLQLTNENHNAYMGSNWDRLDCAVVVIGLIGLLAESLTAFRALRAVRPLRIAIRIEQVKVVLSALIRTVPGMFHAIMFCTLFWFILAVLGVNWFSEKLWYCACLDEDADCDAIFEQLNITDKYSCLANPDVVVWENLQWNFDTVLDGLHTMFTVSTLSGWAETMYSCIASTGRDTLPEMYANPAVGAYFVVIQIVCSFFSLSIIVSTVIDNFDRIKEEKSGTAFLTERQHAWVKSKRITNRIQLKYKNRAPDEGTFYKKVFDLVENPMFEQFIIASIVFNGIFMCMKHYEESDAWFYTLVATDIIFVCIFTVEAVLKITAWGTRGYFREFWNKFDFVIVIAGIISLYPGGFPGIVIFDLFRIGRLLRLINFFPTLRLLLWTLIYAAPALWNIGLLIFIVIFMYAVIGVALFGEWSCGYEGLSEELTEERCAEEGYLINFHEFTEALHLLFRVSTEDGWTDVYSTYQSYAGEKYEWQVYVYFCSFFLLGTMIIVNLFIAVVLDVYAENLEELGQLGALSTVQDWCESWKKFDSDANGWITTQDFISTIMETEWPAGIKYHFERGQKVKVVCDDPEHADYEFNGLMGTCLGIRRQDERISQLEVEVYRVLFEGYEPDGENRAAVLNKYHLEVVYSPDNDFRERKFHVASHIYDLYLVSFLASEEEPQTCGQWLKSSILGFFKLCFGRSEKGAMSESTEDYSEYDEKEWMVEFNACVSAMSLRILKLTGDFNVPIALNLEPGEKYLIDWFCNVYVHDDQMLRDLEVKFAETDRPGQGGKGEGKLLIAARDGMMQRHTGEVEEQNGAIDVVNATGSDNQPNNNQGNNNSNIHAAVE